MSSNFDTSEIYVYAGVGNVDCDSVINLSNIYEEDYDNLFFKRNIGYTQCAISEELKNAVNYFKVKFGIDFTGQIHEKKNCWSILGASLRFYMLSESLNTELIANGLNKTYANIYDGGIIVEIHHPGFMGIYAGNPTYYKPGTFFQWGFQKIKYPDESSKILHYRSIEPTNPHIHNCNSTPLSFSFNHNIYDVCSRRLGTYIGCLMMSTSDEYKIIHLRSVIDFPETIIEYS